METNIYTELASINVNDYVEKKNGLSYLSWAWAVDQLLRRDPAAHWQYESTLDGQPFVLIGDTAMVFCTVTAFGVTRTAQLPVMDHRNKPIPNPDAFQVNTAMQRCLAKAIALHGIGLYIYAGEDLPLGEDDEPAPSTHSASAVQQKPVAKAQEVSAPLLVGETEIQTITNLAQKVGVELSVICKAYKIESIEKLPLNKTAEVVAKLQDKAKAKAKE